MERTELNIAPFFVGQKVVAVAAPPTSRFKNKQEYEVSAMEYRYGNPHHPVGRVTKYWYVGIVGWANGKACYAPHMFAPVKQQEYPAMTFSEIVKMETEEILLNN